MPSCGSSCLHLKIESSELESVRTFLFEAVSAGGEVGVCAADELESVLVLLNAFGECGVVSTYHADRVQFDD